MKIAKIVFSFLLISLLLLSIGYRLYSSIFVRSMLAGKLEEEKFLQENEALISYLPLEQGEATLIELSQGEAYLIDTGNEMSKEQLLELLHDHNIVDIDGIILTNSCDDHVGGLNEVINEFYVHQIYLPELISSSFLIPDSHQSKIKTLKKDDEVELNELKLTVLAPQEPLSLSPQENSLVFQLTHQNVNFLFTSDINEEIEKRLIKQYPLNSEVLKVSDFGNNTASSPEFLEKVDAQIGVIFSSDPELYRTSEDVVERLKETWTDVYEVYEIGEVQVISNGEDYQVNVVKNE